MSSVYMEFIPKMYQTEDLSSSLRNGGHFVRLWGATGTLPSCYHPQSNGQTERVNQDLGSALQCLTKRKTAYWSSFFQLMNMPTIHSPVLPQVCPQLLVFSETPPVHAFYLLPGLFPAFPGLGLCGHSSDKPSEYIDI